MSYPVRRPARRASTPAVSAVGIGAYTTARVADTVITTPVLMVAPAGEANPVAVWIASTFGVGGYVVASLLAIPLAVVLIETLTRLEWPRGSHGTWPVALFKMLLYGWLTVLSAAAAIHNVRVLAGVLPGVLA